ncbi:UNVERIFIED_CONTAM: hypothetical protein HDU68_004577 [Siphonaria sp. JEL0065]|nr:hypothetical protein HDU68_004577 [Siphonaria sp. JEL0065]
MQPRALLLLLVPLVALGQSSSSESASASEAVSASTTAASATATVDVSATSTVDTSATSGSVELTGTTTGTADVTASDASGDATTTTTTTDAVVEVQPTVAPIVIAPAPEITTIARAAPIGTTTSASKTTSQSGSEKIMIASAFIAAFCAFMMMVLPLFVHLASPVYDPRIADAPGKCQLSTSTSVGITGTTIAESMSATSEATSSNEYAVTSTKSSSASTSATVSTAINFYLSGCNKSLVVSAFIAGICALLL